MHLFLKTLCCTLQFNPSEMLSGTLKMCDKDKKFKNAHIGFVQQNIVCYKDAKVCDTRSTCRHFALNQTMHFVSARDKLELYSAY